MNTILSTTNLAPRYELWTISHLNHPLTTEPIPIYSDSFITIAVTNKLTRPKKILHLEEVITRNVAYRVGHWAAYLFVNIIACTFCSSFVVQAVGVVSGTDHCLISDKRPLSTLYGQMLYR